MKNFFADSKSAAKVHITLAVVWLILIIPTVLFWAQSVLWVGIMSCYALFGAHLASYQAAASAGVDEATRRKLNAMAEALAHFMENSDTKDDPYLQPHVDELREAVGLDEEEENIPERVDYKAAWS
jgi:hypothetical protein